MRSRAAASYALSLVLSCLLHGGLVVAPLVAHQWVVTALAKPPVLPVELVIAAEPTTRPEAAPAVPPERPKRVTPPKPIAIPLPRPIEAAPPPEPVRLPEPARPSEPPRLPEP